MPDSLPLVQLQLLKPLLHGLRGRGIDPEAVLESVGLTMRAVDQEGASVHVMVMHQFVENCAEVTKDNTFAAQIGSRLDPSGWPMVGLALDTAATLGEFLNIYVVNAAKVATSATPYLEIRGNITTFGEERRFKPLIEPRQNDGFMISLKLSILENALGPALEPEKVLLVLCDPLVLPKKYARYQSIKGNNMGPRIQFPSEWLAVPLSRYLRAVEPGLPPRKMGQDDFLSSFRGLLEQSIGEGGMNLDGAAKLVHMNSKKLSRTLFSLGTTVSQEVSRAKMNHAKAALSTSTLSIQEIASSLGYTDASNFARAFSKDAGLSPSAYRTKYSSQK